MPLIASERACDCLTHQEVEYAQRLLDASPDLGQLFGVAQRSLQMVRKTRAAASRASVSRARELPETLGIHPLLAHRSR